MLPGCQHRTATALYDHMFGRWWTSTRGSMTFGPTHRRGFGCMLQGGDDMSRHNLWPATIPRLV